ncbi:hypothetical protein BASA81_008672 [Batrachochytrium salamandrivorans]|nr:hypothetical protein BASA81_008672 [Batrachochytrium salamandrivorans]
MSTEHLLTLVQFLSAFYFCGKATQRCFQYISRKLLARSIRVQRPILAEACHEYAVVQVSGPWAMEDRTLVYPLGLPSLGATLFGVFDGHHGHSASQFLVDNLGAVVQHELYENKSLGVAPALHAAFRQIDKSYLAIPHHDSGSTSCVLVVADGKLTVANTGDSRCILVSTLGRVTELSQDHKPDRPDELDRIASLGGSVSHWGVWRLEGVLAMSRAIGDRTLKQYAIPDPEVVEHTVSPTDRYVVLATDGVWDVLSNAEWI